MLVPCHEKNTEKLEWNHRHIPVSVSIYSNADDFTEPFCIVESDVDELVLKILECMVKVGERCYQLAKDKFSDAFRALEEAIKNTENERHVDPDDFF